MTKNDLSIHQGDPFCVVAYCFKDILKRESGVSLMSQVSSQLAKKDWKGRYLLGISRGIFGTFEDDFQRIESQNRISVQILFLLMVETKMIWFLEQSLPFILKKSLCHALSPSDSDIRVCP